MGKKFITETSTIKIGTDLLNAFNDKWIFKEKHLSNITCNKGKFVCVGSGFTPSGCEGEIIKSCSSIKLSVDESSIQDGKKGNFVYEIICIGDATTIDGKKAVNTCTIGGNSDCEGDTIS